MYLHVRQFLIFVQQTVHREFAIEVLEAPEGETFGRPIRYDPQHIIKIHEVFSYRWYIIQRLRACIIWHDQLQRNAPRGWLITFVIIDLKDALIIDFKSPRVGTRYVTFFIHKVAGRTRRGFL